MRECPRCGEPMVASTVTGPSTATASPCGCDIHPEELRD